MSGARVIEGDVDAGSRRIAIVAARFNDFIVSSLLEGAVEAWQQRGGTVEDLVVARVPGAMEVPIAVRKMAASGRYDAIVALGCVIRGDTPHFEYVAGECARGVQLASLETGIPVAFGVLTVNTVDQAVERAVKTQGNKGGEAMQTALEMASLLAQL